MEILCPVCGAHLFRHKRVTGFYRLYVCKDCKYDFLIQKGGVNWSCGFFLCCRTTTKKLNCKRCEFNV